ncbi:HD domain-containing phosphohydrolase [Thermodesulfobacteriota bacterium]
MAIPEPYPLRILAVDDEPIILDLYQKILSSAPLSGELSSGQAGPETEAENPPRPFDIILCHQGDEAVEKVKTAAEENDPIAIAFIDMNMPPGPDGLWTAEHIRELDPYIQIVFVSGYPDIDLIELARRVPPLDKLLYLQKPFQFQEIWQFASSLSEKWKVERQFRTIQAELEGMVERRTASLRESEAKYRALFEDSRDAIYISDAEGKFLDVNPFTLDVFGYTREEMIGKDVLEIYVSPDDYEKFQREIAQKGSVKDYEVTLRTNSDTEMDCLVTSSIWRAEKGSILGYQGIIRDITKQKQDRETLKQTLENLRKTMKGTIQAMADTVETRDPYTAGHQQRVAQLARAIAENMGLSETQTEGIYMAGIIHDLGKISVPAEILSKPGQISEMEFNLIKIHPQAGHDILKKIEFSWPIAQIVLQHHERMNGTGYPDGLAGEDILLEARILAVADTVEAMASHRPYRPAIGIAFALEEISKHKGIFFDPDVVDACLSLFTEKGVTSGETLSVGECILKADVFNS